MSYHLALAGGRSDGLSCCDLSAPSGPGPIFASVPAETGTEKPAPAVCLSRHYHRPRRDCSSSRRAIISARRAHSTVH